MTSDPKGHDCSSCFALMAMGEPKAPLTGKNVLKHDPKAWEEGFKAGESSARISVRCPYPEGTTAAWSWHSGYVEGDAKRQGYSYSRGALLKEPPSGGPIVA